MNLSSLLRRRVLSLALLAAPLAAGAQFEAPAVLPQPSPAAYIKQQLGLTDVSVDYSSPSLRGRNAFGPGGVVPFNELWRAGANRNPIFTTTSDLTVAGKPLPAGTYSLVVLPRESGTWTVVFNRFLQGWGTDNHQEAEDVLRVEVAPITVQEQLENLTYSFADRTDDRMHLVLGWDRVRLPIPLAINLEATVVEQARQQLRSLQQFSWVGTAQIANYLFQRGFAPELALEAVDRSIAVRANPTNLGLKARMLEKAGRAAEATALQPRILETAATDNDLAPYLNTLLVDKAYDRALALATAAAKKFPDSWRPLAWQAQVLNLQGDKPKARSAATKALAKAPADAKPRVEAILQQIGT